MTPDFRLLETMKVTASGEIPLLHRHLARVTKAAEHFGFACNPDAIRAALVGKAVEQKEPIVFRLLVSRSGDFECMHRPMPAPGSFTGLRWAPQPVSSADEFLYYKTTARQVYDQARSGMPPDVDALLYNERGEITETTIANVAILRAGKWITPPISCGLLAGTFRAELLDHGDLVEGVVLKSDLSPGTVVRCFNGVRGMYDLPMMPSQLI